VVAERTLLGASANRIEIYPLRGETSEREMMVHFPAQAEYGSDAFQKGYQRYAFPQAVWELVQAADEHTLTVDRFFMMHVGPRPEPSC
jgi:hypothetical protein